MKTIKYIFAAALAVLAMSCNKGPDSVDGQTVGVTFSAELPGLQTKVIGDGTSATNLTVAVYESDAEGKPAARIAALDRKTKFENLHATVEFQLVKGKTYHFIFWSQADNAPYTFNPNTKDVTISYSGAANDEARDAFYTTKTLKVVESASELVQLRRPFAQVNFGTSDLAAATAAGVTPTLSSFTATEAASTLDLFAGEGKNETNITYTAADLPTEILSLKNGETYTYLAMNYFIPVGKLNESQVATKITATFKSAKDDVTVSVPSVPVQSNWRTNIVGNLLTEQVVFNIEIVPAFENETTIDY